MKKVLITGVAGMIGSHLLDELLEMDYQVIGIDNLSFGTIENIQKHFQNGRFTFHKADILDLERLEKLSNGVDTIFHLASVKKVGGKNYPLTWTFSYPMYSRYSNDLT